MKKWNGIVDEKPSQEFEQRVFSAVDKELGEIQRQNRRAMWRQWLLTLVPVAAVASGVLWWKQKSDDEVDGDIIDLALADNELDIEDMDTLEDDDIDLLEDLEELESWNS